MYIKKLKNNVAKHIFFFCQFINCDIIVYINKFQLDTFALKYYPIIDLRHAYCI